MQLAVQNDLIVHQMDVKTSSLYALIGEEFMQPEGFEALSETGENLVYQFQEIKSTLKVTCLH